MREEDVRQSGQEDHLGPSLRESLRRNSELPASIDVHAAWHDTAHRYGMHAARGVENVSRKPQRFRIALAAAVVAIAVPVLWIYHSSRTAFREQGQVLVYATQSAERLSVQLPDGARLLLAPETWVRYEVSPTGARNLDLQGQAYFTVSHDATRPFVVRAGDVTTDVLGTAFNVRRYAGDSVTEVAVVDGKVASRGLGASILLTAGMAAQMSDSSDARRITNTVDAITEWTRGRLVFRDAPLPDVLRTVGRWCGYQLQLADSSMRAEQVTTVLHIGRPEKTLKMLEELLDVVPTVDGQVITLHPRQTSRVPAPSKRMGRDTTSFPRG